MGTKQVIRLFDSQWVNVVNHDRGYEGYTVEDAVAKAVKLTEEYLAKNFKDGVWPTVEDAEREVDDKRPITCQRRQVYDEVLNMSEISSGLVADFKAALNGAKGEFDAWLECNNGAKVKAAINGLVAEKDAEIREQCRINGMGAERELALLGQIERQSAALKLAKDAIVEIAHVPVGTVTTSYDMRRIAIAAIDALGE